MFKAITTAYDLEQWWLIKYLSNAGVGGKMTL